MKHDSRTRCWKQSRLCDATVSNPTSVLVFLLYQSLLVRRLQYPLWHSATFVDPADRILAFSEHYRRLAPAARNYGRIRCVQSFENIWIYWFFKFKPKPKCTLYINLIFRLLSVQTRPGYSILMVSLVIGYSIQHSFVDRRDRQRLEPVATGVQGIAEFFATVYSMPVGLQSFQLIVARQTTLLDILAFFVQAFPFGILKHTCNHSDLRWNYCNYKIFSQPAPQLSGEKSEFCSRLLETNSSKMDE